MKVHFVIDIPNVRPNSMRAVDAVDAVERIVGPVLDAARHEWWIAVEGGETRYMPDAEDRQEGSAR